MLRALPKLAIFGLALFVGAGCKQILGLEERTLLVDAGVDSEADAEGLPEAGKVSLLPVSGQCGPLRHPGASCAACMDQNCCVEASACHDDGSCNAAFDCIVACGDDGTCRSRCGSFLSRTSALVGIQACRESHCSTECGYSCGGLGYNAAGCETCVKATCCEEAARCAQNLDCQSLDLCRSNCLSGSSCPSLCDKANPNGTADYAAWRACTQNACGEACLPGRDWSCLDAPLWPSPSKLEDITFSATIADLLTEEPYVGASVKACQRSDLDCIKPISSAVTDETGLVSLTVPVGTSGFDGYLEIRDGSVGSAGGPIYPTLYYPVPPIISGGWRGKIQFVSAANLAFLSLATNAEVDDTLGHFAANAEDCSLAPAGGVSFTADPVGPKTKPFYFVSNLPSTSADRTEGPVPIGGFVNLPAQLVRIKARAAGAGDKSMGSLLVQIKAGYLTSTSFPPNPNLR